VDKTLLSIFKRDAEKAVRVLTETQEAGDWKLFAITAHAMKSASANIGEEAVSSRARELEKAAKEEDAAFIAANAPRLIEDLSRLAADIARAEQADKAREASQAAEGEPPPEDADFVKRQFEIIQAACAEYDRTVIKAALSTLKTRPLKSETNALLEEIASLLLHSSFEEIAELVSGAS
jgi:HPt (histidine-containing phosphotransfer) domain-containing protein